MDHRPVVVKGLRVGFGRGDVVVDHAAAEALVEVGYRRLVQRWPSQVIDAFECFTHNRIAEPVATPVGVRAHACERDDRALLVLVSHPVFKGSRHRNDLARSISSDVHEVAFMIGS